MSKADPAAKPAPHWCIVDTVLALVLAYCIGLLIGMVVMR